MTKILNHQPCDPTVNWLESDHQIHVVQWLRRNGYCVAADQNGATNQRRSQRLAEGLQPGEPDLRIYLPNGRLMLIEMKRHKGKLSPQQVAHHERLESLGHHVFVIIERTPADSLKKVIDIVKQTNYTSIPEEEER